MRPELQDPAQPAVPAAVKSDLLSQNGKQRLRAAGIAALMLAVVFFKPLANWIHFALDEERQSYLILVPAICTYLIWIVRKELRLEFKTSIGPAIFFGLLGIGAFLFAQLNGNWPHAVDRLAAYMLSLVLLIVTLAFLFVGAPILRQLTFPVAFLIFCVPVPTFLGNAIEIFLQYTSAEAAYWLLSLTNVPMLRNGLDFTLPGIPLRVAQECSGYNSTFSLFLVSLVAGHLFLQSPTRRAALALFVIPLAIIRNGFRIMTIALLCVYVDPNMIDSFIHHKGGPIFFALSLIPFFGLLWALRRAEIAKRRNANVKHHE